MRTTLLAAVGGVFMCTMTPAFSADMPVKAVPYGVAPIFSWTGFYLGANIGYGFGRANTDYTVTAPAVPLTFTVLDNTTTPKGLSYGGQVGYNWQLGAWVFGGEADFQWSGEKADQTVTAVCPAGVCAVLADVVTATRTDKITWFGTARGRAGIAFDRWMVYGTGGLAVGHFQSAVTLTTVGGTTSYTEDQNRVGWTIGAGAEAAIWNNWSVKAEYLYMDFGTSTTAEAVLAPVIIGGATVAQSTRLTNQVIRAGINYRF